MKRTSHSPKCRPLPACYWQFVLDVQLEGRAGFLQEPFTVSKPTEAVHAEKLGRKHPLSAIAQSYRMPVPVLPVKMLTGHSIRTVNYGCGI
jgi:hypothetical protein